MIKPLPEYVIIEKDNIQRSESSLIELLPSQTQMRGIGLEVHASDTIFSVGDDVLFGKFSTKPFEIGGKHCLLVHHDNIMAKVAKTS